MKALIWIGCIFLSAILSTVLSDAGIRGAIPSTLLFCGMMWVARTLCKKYDERKSPVDKSNEN